MVAANSQGTTSGDGRRVAQVGARLEKDLLMYTLSATAAGVGMLALGAPAEGKVVYTGGNVNIVQNGGLFALDLNHDGKADFSISNFSYSTHGAGSRFLKIIPAVPSNQFVVASNRDHVVAAALSTGKRVGPKGRFQQESKGLFMAHYGRTRTYGGYTYFGSWWQVETAFLGFKFVIKGQPHYGWARIKYNSPFGIYSATLSGYAYETVPNKSLITGKKGGAVAAGRASAVASGLKASAQPGSLGSLAAGSAGIRWWRHRSESGGGRHTADSAGQPNRKEF